MGREGVRELELEGVGERGGDWGERELEGERERERERDVNGFSNYPLPHPVVEHTIVRCIRSEPWAALHSRSTSCSLGLGKTQC